MKNDKIKLAYEEIVNEKNNSINEELKIKFNELCTYLSWIKEDLNSEEIKELNEKINAVKQILNKI